MRTALRRSVYGYAAHASRQGWIAAAWVSRRCFPLVLLLPSAAGAAELPPPLAERAAIMTLLDTYAQAVTTKNRATFETLLLDRDIPFSYVAAVPAAGGAAAWRNYGDFRRAVFEGPPFVQRFRDISIRRHGGLADVDLVYVNTDAHGAHPGWKTMQLLKVDGRWKIASEFFTDLTEPSK